MQARCEPKPIQMPYPPFAFVGSGEQLTLRVVARYADVWNATPADVEEFRHKVRILHEHCAAVGRDPGQIELSVQARVTYDDLPATVATLQPLVEAGATHLVLMLASPYPDGIVARLADEVVARVG
jgi:alkanesulfonate monooxygenase SsuD/methylene tetrahydromethanopterin reductase-like flavin-dependent oxidoreductase (luciferase family)